MSAGVVSSGFVRWCALLVAPLVAVSVVSGSPAGAVSAGRPHVDAPEPVSASVLRQSVRQGSSEFEELFRSRLPSPVWPEAGAMERLPLDGSWSAGLRANEVGRGRSGGEHPR